MSATEVLKEEHRVIERMLKILEFSTEKLQRNEEVSPKNLRKSRGFYQGFSP